MQLRIFLELIIKHFKMSWRSGDMVTEILITIAMSFVLAIREIIPVIQQIMPFLFVIAFGATPLSILISVIKEKSLGYKTIQIVIFRYNQIQGCNNYVYTLSWVIIGYCRMFICITAYALSQLIFMWMIGFDWDKFYHVSFLSTIIQLLVFGILAINQQFMIASFLNDVLAASSVYLYICFFQIFQYFVLEVKSIAENRLFYIILTSISPQCGLAFSYLSSLKTQQFTSPFEVDIFLHELIDETFSQQDVINLMLILYCIYTIIFLYVDQVMPNSFGSSKSLTFCFDIFRSRQQQQNYNLIEQQDVADDVRYDNKNLRQQPVKQNNYSCIEIRNLTKKFNDFQALNNISLDIYEGEIFCLLGHNGAGKTTLINCLTGMLQVTSGKVKLFGKLIDSDREEFKNLIGFCMQFDSLYEYLTVQEHLLLVTSIKQSSGSDIQEIMVLTQLMDHQNVQANKLSTGKRRLLSFAMALIGGSKILFLDEPTSAMDGVSRKKIWEIIRNIKLQNRTIILTSHDLSEVEELSDRIGILNHGELIILGDKEFIDSELGGGYQLHLYYENENSNQFQVIEQILCKEFQEISIQQSNIQLLRQTFQIKSKSKEMVLKILNTIENISKVKFTLKQITLEQAFETISESINSRETLEIKSSNENIQIQLVQPKYNFLSQVEASFIKKWQIISSEFSSIIYITMPILAFINGPLVIGQIDYNEVIGQVLMKSIIIEFVQLQLIASSLLIGLCPNIVMYVYMPVHERQVGLKQISDVIGVNKLAYWMGLFLVDLLQYIFIIAIYYITCWVYDVSIMFKYFYQIMYIISCFAPFYIVHYYVLSFWFKQSENAIKYITLYSFFAEFVAASVLKIVFWHYFSSAQYANLIIDSYEILMVIISPPFALYRTMIFTNEKFRMIKPFIKHRFPYSTYQPYTYLMIFSSLMHIILLYYLETRQIRSKKVTEGEQLQEINQITEQRSFNTSTLICESIEQQYNQKQGTILKQISFNLDKAQFMTIVGPNGAGKSTIMNIISELNQPTSGSLRVQADYIDRGICPQYINFQDNLTCQQNLSFQSRIKYLNTQERKQQVQFYLEILNLKIYQDIKAKHLSGGNKRKLSFAMSLIGGTRLVFLDEPLTGVDPNSRQVMIDLLQLHRNTYGSTIILASPNTEYSGDYCNQIAILFDGELSFIGSPKSLMDKYQLGVKVDIILKEQMLDIENMKEKLQQDFQYIKIQIQEQDKCKLTCFIKQNKFSQVFNYFTKLQIDERIKDFEVHDDQLDSIFMHLSEGQQLQARLQEADQIESE